MPSWPWERPSPPSSWSPDPGAGPPYLDVLRYGVPGAPGSGQSQPSVVARATAAARVGGLEVGQRIGDMAVHGVLAEDQLGGDLGRRQAAGHQPQDVLLAGGDRRRPAPTAGEPSAEGAREGCPSGGPRAARRWTVRRRGGRPRRRRPGPSGWSPAPSATRPRRRRAPPPGSCGSRVATDRRPPPGGATRASAAADQALSVSLVRTWARRRSSTAQEAAASCAPAARARTTAGRSSPARSTTSAVGTSSSMVASTAQAASTWPRSARTSARPTTARRSNSAWA